MTETDQQNGSTDVEDGFAGSIVNEPRTVVPNLAVAKVDGLGCHAGNDELRKAAAA